MTQLPPSTPGEGPNLLEYGGPMSKTSGMAIASMVLGILAIPLLCFLIGIPLAIVGLILGIVALLKINKEPLRFSGKGFAITGIIISSVGVVLFLPLMIAILLPSLGKARELSNRSVCAANLRGIMQTMLVYANDNADAFPTLPYASYGPANTGTSTATLPARTPGDAFRSLYGPTSMQDGSPLGCLWVLVVNGQVSAKSFICRSTSESPALVNAPTGDYFANFQADSQISYSVAYPWQADGKVGRWWISTNDASLPLIADMTPLQGTGTPPRDVMLATTSKIRNSGNHQGDGQNVAYADGHADFMRQPDAGQDSDNIYTASKSPSMGPAQYGGIPSGTAAPLLMADRMPFDIVMVPARDLNSGKLK